MSRTISAGAALLGRVKAVAVPHEHAAICMAHGFYLATGRPQAAMAHTNVGLADCAIGAINAHVEHVPVRLFSGRTPTVEKGRFGARTMPVTWGRKMLNQAAVVREVGKWDCELRYPELAPDIVDRAYAIAGSTPRGRVPRCWISASGASGERAWVRRRRSRRSASSACVPVARGSPPFPRA